MKYQVEVIASAKKSLKNIESPYVKLFFSAEDDVFRQSLADDPVLVMVADEILRVRLCAPAAIFTKLGPGNGRKRIKKQAPG